MKAIYRNAITTATKEVNNNIRTAIKYIALCESPEIKPLSECFGLTENVNQKKREAAKAMIERNYPYIYTISLGTDNQQSKAITVNEPANIVPCVKVDNIQYFVAVSLIDKKMIAIGEAATRKDNAMEYEKLCETFRKLWISRKENLKAVKVMLSQLKRNKPAGQMLVEIGAYYDSKLQKITDGELITKIEKAIETEKEIKRVQNERAKIGRSGNIDDIRRMLAELENNQA